jgi:chromosome segregation ATPase
MDARAARRELKSCEQHLADIREIMISKEAKLNQLKAKRILIENNLPGLSEKVALGEIPSEQLIQAKESLQNLKRQLFEIPILLKGLKSEEPQYIERISKAKRIIDIDRRKGDVKSSKKNSDRWAQIHPSRL